MSSASQFFSGGSTGGFYNQRYFTASTSFIVPATLKYLITVIGAGGSGSSPSATLGGGAGGGAGGLAQSYIKLNQGTVLTLTVGSGGNAPAFSGGPNQTTHVGVAGTNGGNSSVVGTGISMTATGGYGAPISTGNAGGAGGIASGGNIMNVAGGNGGYGASGSTCGGSGGAVGIFGTAYNGATSSGAARTVGAGITGDGVISAINNQLISGNNGLTLLSESSSLRIISPSANNGGASPSYYQGVDGNSNPIIGGGSAAGRFCGGAGAWQYSGGWLAYGTSGGQFGGGGGGGVSLSYWQNPNQNYVGIPGGAGSSGAVFIEWVV